MATDVRSAAERGRPEGTRDPLRPAVLLWIFAGVVAAAVLVGAVVGALREATPLDRDSPEGVVQAFLQAVFDGDYSAALTFLDSDTTASCDQGDFRAAWIPESMTAALDDVRVRDGEAEVSVRLRTVTGPEPFGSGAYSSQETFELIHEGGVWRITEGFWPVYDCAGRS